MYEDEFKVALERTRKFGLSPPELFESYNGRFLNKKILEELPCIIREKLGILKEDEIVLQCLMLNIRLKNVFSDYFNCPVYFTIGHVGINNKYMFKQTEKSLLSLFKNGIKRQSINLHAWLTLPTMEILDFSISTSYGKVHGKEEMMGAAVALHPSELTHGMSFHPMLVGEEFLQKIGALNFQFAIGI